MKIMVFSPHPDDDVIGCGGSILKHTKNGHEVTIVYMTNGDAGSLQHNKEELAEMRKREAQAAASTLGVKQTIFLDVHDGYLEFSSEILTRVVKLLREHQPEVVYMPHALEAHRDHANTFALVNEAVKRANFNSYQEYGASPLMVKTVFCYEVWTPLQEVQYIEDISDVMEDKIHALKQHVSQLSILQYDKAVRGLNTYRGLMTGKGEYAECFQVVKITNYS